MSKVRDIVELTRTNVVDADIGSSVQAFDTDTAKLDAAANFTVALQHGGSDVVVDTDIGSTVQAYDATIVVDADIGSTVQAYDATIVVDADIGVNIEAYDANKYPAPTITGVDVTATNASYYIASAGGITITLPASPSAGNYVIIKDGTGAAATTTFTVARNGSNITSSATDLIFDKNYAQVVMTYIDGTIGWSI